MANTAKKTTKTKNTKSKKDNSGLIAGICAAVVVAIIAIVAVVVINMNKGLDDSYFVSDGTKYVLTLENDSDDEDMKYTKIHYVYTYSGDEITGLKQYFEFKNEKDAQDALKEIQADGESSDYGYESVESNGKYLIITMKKEQYDGQTASDVKESIDAYNSLKDMNLDDYDEGGIEIEETEE